MLSSEEIYHVLLRDGAHAFDVDVDDDLGGVACEISHERLFQAQLTNGISDFGIPGISIGFESEPIKIPRPTCRS